MNHFNKQLEVNQPTLEHYLDEENRRERMRTRFDQFGLGILIFCGFIGVIYCLANDHLSLKKLNGESRTPQFQEAKYGMAIAGTSTVASSTDANSSPSSAELFSFVSVEGQSKTGESLTFTLDAFNDAATYEFHFGNGERMVAKTSQLTYSYDLPGNYEATLEVTYEGETKQAWSKILNISY